MARVVGPKVALNSSAAAHSPTLQRAIDFIGTAALVAFLPIGATGVALFAGAVLFYGFGSWTGLTAAWASLAGQVSAPELLTGPALLNAVIQNFSFAFILALFLAIPAVRSTLQRTRTKRLVSAVASPNALSAMSLGVSCFCLQVVLSLAIGGLLDYREV